MYVLNIQRLLSQGQSIFQLQIVRLHALMEIQAPVRLINGGLLLHGIRQGLRLLMVAIFPILPHQTVREIGSTYCGKKIWRLKWQEKLKDQRA